MEEIKFRGQRTDNREWVYGDLLQFNDGSIHIAVHSETWTDDGFHNDDYESVFTVDENTVGRFTGLYDNNGNETYNGDIVVSNKGLKGVITWSCNNASFQIEWRNTKPVYGVFNASIIKDFEIRVIGNIHHIQSLFDYYEPRTCNKCKVFDDMQQNCPYSPIYQYKDLNEAKMHLDDETDCEFYKKK